MEKVNDGCLKMEDGKRMMEIENHEYHIIHLTSSILHKKRGIIYQDNPPISISCCC